MPKLQESQGRFFLTVPREWVEKFKWKKGQALHMLPINPLEKKLLVEERKE